MYRTLLKIIYFVFGGFIAANPLMAATDQQTSCQPDQLCLVFAYGSEKDNWLQQATPAFNDAGHRTNSGKPIHVQLEPMGSGETIKTLKTGKPVQPHLISPASEVFIKLAEAELGDSIIGTTRSLVRSPMVIAMWKKMADAMSNNGKKRIGWHDVLNLINDDNGWGRYGHPEWGTMKYGHTHPEFSNSGLLTLIAQVYAGIEKNNNLTLDDVRHEETVAFLQEIESGVIHYGRSTGFFGRKMLQFGPETLSAAVLYENMVIESYSGENNSPEPLVAVYPKEGTFWSDHPVGIVYQDWVSREHEQAAQIYIEYLLEEAQQQKAVELGFRRSELMAALGSPFDAAHGVDPNQPEVLYPVPEVAVVDAILDLWREYKKPADVVLVIDTSGSMETLVNPTEQRIDQAKTGAKRIVDMLGPQDQLSILSFSRKARWQLQRLAMDESGKAKAETVIDKFKPFGKTALYDAALRAHKLFEQDSAENNVIRAVILLSDGADTSSKTPLSTILQDISDRKALFFTIGYGLQQIGDKNESDALRKVLQDIAQATTAKYYDGTPENLQQMMQEAAAFFAAK